MDLMALQEDLLQKMKLLATIAASDYCTDEQRSLLNEQLQLLQQYSEIIGCEHSERFHPVMGGSIEGLQNSVSADSVHRLMCSSKRSGKWIARAPLKNALIL